MPRSFFAAALPFDVRTADVAANLASVERGLRAAADAGIALVVLPEMWPTSFPTAGDTSDALLAASDDAVARVAGLSRELSLVVCGSAFGSRVSGSTTHGERQDAHGRAPTPIEHGSDGGPIETIAHGERSHVRSGRDHPSSATHVSTPKPTNRLHVLDRGELVLAYDKIHLFTPTAEEETFTAGDGPPLASTSVGRIGGVICYDLRFPEVARALFRQKAEILVVPAQWPAPRTSQWRALVLGRAVESQAFVVACNRTGRATIGRRGLELVFPASSLVCDPDGRVLAEGTETERAPHADPGTSRSDEPARQAASLPGAREDGEPIVRPGPDTEKTALVAASIDLDVARRMRVRVPVGKDERPDLYTRW